MRTKKFKRYDQNQLLLLPPSLESLIGPRELVRTVDRVVDELDPPVVEKPFHGEGCPPYNPWMMLKILIFGYCLRIYSSRQLARAVRRDVQFMWLAGMSAPDFRTINRFRGVYFKEVLPELFAGVAQLLLEEKYLKMEDYFLDGTKIEADANKHSAVWRKNMERYRERVRQRAREIIAEAELADEEEERKYEGKDLPELGEESELTSGKIKAKAAEISAKAEEEADKANARKQERAAKQLKEEAEKLEKYEEQEELLDGRNSYSKTDPDATFMRMKNDELRAGYNLQAGTENGFVTGYSLSQNANDGASLKDHFEERKALGLARPERVTADAGYGTEENYEYLEAEGIGNYAKYQAFAAETKGKEAGPYGRDRFGRDEEKKIVICPLGHELKLSGVEEETRKTGYVSRVEQYRGEFCGGCAHRGECALTKNGIFSYNPVLERHKQIARANLESEEGLALRRRRGNEIESVWGDLKHNQLFRRFHLRGLLKCIAEAGLLFISFNLRKLHLKECAAAVC